jgi:hypothetical protein
MALWILSVIIVTSMLCSYLITIRPPRQPIEPTPPPMTIVPRDTDTPVPAAPAPSETSTQTPAP